MIKNLLRHIILKEKASSTRYIKYLRKKGVIIGEGCEIFAPSRIFIDLTRPYLIEIGDNVQITNGVTILTHGYDWSVLKEVYGEVLGSAGAVVISNNVFIGMNAIILKGVHIGENVIIGAGSLVNKSIPDNCVAAGNPCKVIMSLEEYYRRRRDAQECEAVQIVNKYRKVFGHEPNEEQLNEFFWLFSSGDDVLHESWKSIMRLGGNEQLCSEALNRHVAKYESMTEFLRSVK